MYQVGQQVYYNPYPEFLSEPLPFIVVDIITSGEIVLIIENVGQDLLLSVSPSQLEK